MFGFGKLKKILNPKNKDENEKHSSMPIEKDLISVESQDYMQQNIQNLNSNYAQIVLDEGPNMAKAIFLQKYNHKGISERYEGYFKYKYNVKDAKKLHKEFIKQGLLVEMNLMEDVNFILKQKTVNELKEILKNKNLPISGKKSDLIERLSNTVLSKEELQIKTTLYKISPEAKEYLKKYDFLHMLHNCRYEIDLEDYLQYKKELEKSENFPKARFADVCWAIFNKRTLKHFRESDYGLLRNNFFNMYRLTKEEKRPLLRMLCNVLFIDLSGMGNSNCVEDFNSMFFEGSPIAPALSAEIKKYDLNDITTEMKVINFELPFQYFTIDQMIQIISDEYNEINHNIKKLKKIAKKPEENSSKYVYYDFNPYYD